MSWQEWGGLALMAVFFLVWLILLPRLGLG